MFRFFWLTKTWAKIVGSMSHTIKICCHVWFFSCDSLRKNFHFSSPEVSLGFLYIFKHMTAFSISYLRAFQSMNLKSENVARHDLDFWWLENKCIQNWFYLLKFINLNLNVSWRWTTRRRKIVKVGVIMNFHDAFDIDASLDKGDDWA